MRESAITPAMPLVAILLGNGLLLGLGAAAPIGPVNVEIARRTLRHGPAAVQHCLTVVESLKHTLDEIAHG